MKPIMVVLFLVPSLCFGSEVKSKQTVANACGNYSTTELEQECAAQGQKLVRHGLLSCTLQSRGDYVDWYDVVVQGVCQ